MPVNEIHPNSYPPFAGSDFDKNGHPGKFHKVYTCSGSTFTTFTGSNFGAGALIVPTGSAGTVYLSKSGSLPLSALPVASIYELSIRSIDVTAGTVYVLIRNQTVR